MYMLERYKLEQYKKQKKYWKQYLELLYAQACEEKKLKLAR